MPGRWDDVGTVLQAETPGQPLYFKSVFIPMCLVFSVLFMLFMLLFFIENELAR